MTKKLTGKVALVTGAGSEHGIGFASARLLAEAGADVMVTDKVTSENNMQDQLEQRVASIVASGGAASQYGLDVTDRENVESVVKQISGAHGGIDILFSNAGIGRTAPFLEMPESMWDLIYEVNQKGMINVCRAVIPSMISRGGGSVILTSSMSGLSGLEQYSAYTMTKYAVVGLTKCLAHEFGKLNIRCNCICPGNIATEMGLHEVTERAEFLGIPVTEARKMLNEECALNRMGEPEEIAEAVRFLASDASRFITGVALPVSGGMFGGI